mgnify:FL=1|tara:strand:- start:829 stop:1074 length:246 start_codon:yes stop_codon:yes gene_type:complete
MGRIFKTPSDNAVEETLRAMHTQNVLDNTYEKTVGWVKVLLLGTVAVFTLSAVEYYTDWNLWESTGNWLSEWAERQLEKLI